VWEEGGVGVFVVAVPGGSGCAFRAVEVEAVDGWGEGVLVIVEVGGKRDGDVHTSAFGVDDEFEVGFC
jgi:L-aminopeptidase/D-esterase-like protein